MTNEQRQAKKKNGSDWSLFQKDRVNTRGIDNLIEKDAIRTIFEVGRLKKDAIRSE
jgi:endo-1,4-beta-D-glucanase Y